MEIYFFIFHVQPRPDPEDADNVGGAYVNCWIKADSITGAQQIARQKIDDLKWHILEKDNAFELPPGHYSPDSDGFEFYQQALIDKFVLRFHTYPAEQ